MPALDPNSLLYLVLEVYTTWKDNGTGPMVPLETIPNARAIGRIESPQIKALWQMAYRHQCFPETVGRSAPELLEVLHTLMWCEINKVLPLQDHVSYGLAAGWTVFKVARPEPEVMIEPKNRPVVN